MAAPVPPPRIGLVGCGHRGIVGFLASLKAIGRAGQVAALCDPNPARLNFAWTYLGEQSCLRYSTLDALLAAPAVDTVIVATPDFTHADIVTRCLAAGKAVVCEKPMATTLADCRRILSAAKGTSFRMAFNFRYNAVSLRVRELLQAGVIGRVFLVEARDMVAADHGADYFRRWHRRQACSGGLLVHKSVHVFDAINWWLGDVPQAVFARAARRFFLPERRKGTRCLTCPGARDCEFYADLRADVQGQFCGIARFYEKMYLDGEPHDGYIRDACVFSPESDVPDTYQVTATYRGGTGLSYTAVFYAPYADREFVLQGERGRMEVSVAQRRIHVRPLPGRGSEQVITVPPEEGGHGGADLRLAKALFESAAPDDARGTLEAGYWSVALADAANRSIQSGNETTIDDPPTL